MAGEGCNLELLVISDGFQSMPVMKRQQSLLKLFADDLTSGRLHAISIKAKSPAEMNAANTHLVQLEGM
ncbi:MAG: BolA family transcriptional regulator [Zetaproteobacteria bacterium CG23_combo_of_CG06-09_8_20_14_all_54_7]|nr:MAG: BolA family transcriptional regulator [Zetaproteobacteria bacterium CG23_combo_of_CG06-09_8_20_14_all_54_7]